MGRIETELQSSWPVSSLSLSLHTSHPPLSSSLQGKKVNKNSLAIFKNSICFAAVAAKAQTRQKDMARKRRR
jgi:hypothetical protein